MERCAETQVNVHVLGLSTARDDSGNLSNFGCRESTNEAQLMLSTAVLHDYNKSGTSVKQRAAGARSHSGKE